MERADVARWGEIEQLFNQAVLLSASERNQFLKQNCVGDDELFTEISSLFDAHDLADNFLEKPIFPDFAELLDNEYHELLANPDFASYNLIKLIGRGGMGMVFLAQDTSLERRVAVKILPIKISENSEIMKRFRQEAKAASAISHQSVAHIYEFGNYKGTYFLAMEYIEGITLRELINREEIKISRALDIVLQVAEALCAAHAQHITHRDIKPENVMVTESGLVKVLDFGLAKLGEKRYQNNQPSLKTLPGMVLGTTSYMSPEQIRGEQTNEKTDLWSLGVILYELLNNERPFVGETKNEIQASILVDSPPALNIFRYVSSLKIIIDKTLAKKSENRFSTANELVDALKIARREVYDYTEKNQMKNNKLRKIYNRFVGREA